MSIETDEKQIKVDGLLNEHVSRRVLFGLVNKNGKRDRKSFDSSQVKFTIHRLVCLWVFWFVFSVLSNTKKRGADTE